jgi:hypothetical protein
MFPSVSLLTTKFVTAGAITTTEWRHQPQADPLNSPKMAGSVTGLPFGGSRLVRALTDE